MENLVDYVSQETTCSTDAMRSENGEQFAQPARASVATPDPLPPPPEFEFVDMSVEGSFGTESDNTLTTQSLFSAEETLVISQLVKGRTVGSTEAARNDTTVESADIQNVVLVESDCESTLGSQINSEADDEWETDVEDWSTDTDGEIDSHPSTFSVVGATPTTVTLKRTVVSGENQQTTGQPTDTCTDGTGMIQDPVHEVTSSTDGTGEIQDPVDVNDTKKAGVLSDPAILYVGGIAPNVPFTAPFSGMAELAATGGDYFDSDSESKLATLVVKSRTTRQTGSLVIQNPILAGLLQDLEPTPLEEALANGLVINATPGLESPQFGVPKPQDVVSFLDRSSPLPPRVIDMLELKPQHPDETPKAFIPTFGPQGTHSQQTINNIRMMGEENNNFEVPRFVPLVQLPREKMNEDLDNEHYEELDKRDVVRHDHGLFHAWHRTDTPVLADVDFCGNFNCFCHKMVPGHRLYVSFLFAAAHSTGVPTQGNHYFANLFRGSEAFVVPANYGTTVEHELHRTRTRRVRECVEDTEEDTDTVEEYTVIQRATVDKTQEVLKVTHESVREAKVFEPVLTTEPPVYAVPQYVFKPRFGNVPTGFLPRVEYACLKRRYADAFGKIKDPKPRVYKVNQTVAYNASYVTPYTINTHLERTVTTRPRASVLRFATVSTQVLVPFKVKVAYMSSPKKTAKVQEKQKKPAPRKIFPLHMMTVPQQQQQKEQVPDTRTVNLKVCPFLTHSNDTNDRTFCWMCNTDRCVTAKCREKRAAAQTLFYRLSLNEQERVAGCWPHKGHLTFSVQKDGGFQRQTAPPPPPPPPPSSQQREQQQQERPQCKRKEKQNNVDPDVEQTKAFLSYIDEHELDKFIEELIKEGHGVESILAIFKRLLRQRKDATFMFALLNASFKLLVEETVVESVRLERLKTYFDLQLFIIDGEVRGVNKLKPFHISIDKGVYVTDHAQRRAYNSRKEKPAQSQKELMQQQIQEPMDIQSPAVEPLVVPVPKPRTSMNVVDASVFPREQPKEKRQPRVPRSSRKVIEPQQEELTWEQQCEQLAGTVSAVEPPVKQQKFDDGLNWEQQCEAAFKQLTPLEVPKPKENFNILDALSKIAFHSANGPTLLDHVASFVHPSKVVALQRPPQKETMRHRRDPKVKLADLPQKDYMSYGQYNQRVLMSGGAFTSHKSGPLHNAQFSIAKTDLAVHGIPAGLNMGLGESNSYSHFTTTSLSTLTGPTGYCLEKMIENMYNATGRRTRPLTVLRHQNNWYHVLQTPSGFIHRKNMDFVPDEIIQGRFMFMPVTKPVPSAVGYVQVANPGTLEAHIYSFFYDYDAETDTFYESGSLNRDWEGLAQPCVGMHDIKFDGHSYAVMLNPKWDTTVPLTKDTIFAYPHTLCFDPSHDVKTDKLYGSDNVHRKRKNTHDDHTYASKKQCTSTEHVLSTTSCVNILNGLENVAYHSQFGYTLADYLKSYIHPSKATVFTSTKKKLQSMAKVAGSNVKLYHLRRQDTVSYCYDEHNDTVNLYGEVVPVFRTGFLHNPIYAMVKSDVAIFGPPDNMHLVESPSNEMEFFPMLIYSTLSGPQGNCVERFMEQLFVATGSRALPLTVHKHLGRWYHVCQTEDGFHYRANMDFTPEETVQGRFMIKKVDAYTDDAVGFVEVENPNTSKAHLKFFLYQYNAILDIFVKQQHTPLFDEDYAVPPITLNDIKFNGNTFAIVLNPDWNPLVRFTPQMVLAYPHTFCLDPSHDLSTDKLYGCDDNFYLSVLKAVRFDIYYPSAYFKLVFALTTTSHKPRLTNDSPQKPRKSRDRQCISFTYPTRRANCLKANYLGKPSLFFGLYLDYPNGFTFLRKFSNLDLRFNKDVDYNKCDELATQFAVDLFNTTEPVSSDGCNPRDDTFCFECACDGHISTRLTGPVGACLSRMLFMMCSLDGFQCPPFDMYRANGVWHFLANVDGVVNFRQHLLPKSIERYINGRYMLKRTVCEIDSYGYIFCTTTKHVYFRPYFPQRKDWFDLNPRIYAVVDNPFYYGETLSITHCTAYPHTFMLDPRDETNEDKLYGTDIDLYQPQVYKSFFRQHVGTQYSTDIPLDDGNIALIGDQIAFIKLCAGADYCWYPLMDCSFGEITAFTSLPIAQFQLHEPTCLKRMDLDKNVPYKDADACTCDNGPIVCSFPTPLRVPCKVAKIPAKGPITITDPEHLNVMRTFPLLVARGRYNFLISTTIIEAEISDYPANNPTGTTCGYMTATYVANNLLGLDDTLFSNAQACNWDLNTMCDFVDALTAIFEVQGINLHLGQNLMNSSYKAGYTIFITPVPTSDTVAAYGGVHIVPCNGSGVIHDDGFTGIPVMPLSHYWNVVYVQPKFEFVLFNKQFIDCSQERADSRFTREGYPVISVNGANTVASVPYYKDQLHSVLPLSGYTDRYIDDSDLTTTEYFIGAISWTPDETSDTIDWIVTKSCAFHKNVYLYAPTQENHSLQLINTVPLCPFDIEDIDDYLALDGSLMVRKVARLSKRVEQLTCELPKLTEKGKPSLSDVIDVSESSLPQTTTVSTDNTSQEVLTEELNCSVSDFEFGATTCTDSSNVLFDITTISCSHTSISYIPEDLSATHVHRCNKNSEHIVCVDTTYMVKTTTELSSLVGKVFDIHLVGESTVYLNSPIYRSQLLPYQSNQPFTLIGPQDLLPSDTSSCLDLDDVYDPVVHAQVMADLAVVNQEEKAMRETLSGLVPLVASATDDVTRNYLSNRVTDTKSLLATKTFVQANLAAEAKYQEKLQKYDTHTFMRMTEVELTSVVTIPTNIPTIVVDEVTTDAPYNVIIQNADEEYRDTPYTLVPGDIKILHLSGIRSKSFTYMHKYLAFVKQVVKAGDVILNNCDILPSDFIASNIDGVKIHATTTPAESSVEESTFGLEVEEHNITTLASALFAHNEYYNHSCTKETIFSCNCVPVPVDFRSTIYENKRVARVDWPYQFDGNLSTAIAEGIKHYFNPESVTVSNDLRPTITTNNAISFYRCSNCDHSYSTDNSNTFNAASVDICRNCSKGVMCLSHKNGYALCRTMSEGPYRVSLKGIYYKLSYIVAFQPIISLYKGPQSTRLYNHNSGVMIDSFCNVNTTPSSSLMKEEDLQFSIVKVTTPPTLADMDTWSGRTAAFAANTLKRSLPCDINSAPYWHLSATSNVIHKDLIEPLKNPNSEVFDAMKKCPSTHLVYVNPRRDYTTTDVLALLETHGTYNICANKVSVKPKTKWREQLQPIASVSHYYNVLNEHTKIRDFVFVPLMLLFLNFITFRDSAILTFVTVCFYVSYLLRFRWNMSYREQASSFKHNFILFINVFFKSREAIRFRALLYRVLITSLKWFHISIDIRNRKIKWNRPRFPVGSLSANILIYRMSILFTTFISVLIPLTIAIWAISTSYRPYASSGYLADRMSSYVSLVEACQHEDPKYCLDSPNRYDYMWLENLPEWSLPSTISHTSFYEMVSEPVDRVYYNIVMFSILLLIHYLSPWIVIYTIINFIAITVLSVLQYKLISTWFVTSFADVFLTYLLSHYNMASFAIAFVMSRGLYKFICMFHSCRTNLCRACQDKHLPATTKTPISTTHKVGNTQHISTFTRGKTFCNKHNFFCSHKHLMTPAVSETLFNKFKIATIPDKCYQVERMSPATWLSYRQANMLTDDSIANRDDYFNKLGSSVYVVHSPNSITTLDKQAATYLSFYANKCCVIVHVSEDNSTVFERDSTDELTHKFNYAGPIYFPVVKKFLAVEGNLKYDPNIDLSTLTLITTDQGLTRSIYYPKSMWDAFSSTTKVEIRTVWPHVMLYEDTISNVASHVDRVIPVPTIPSVSAGFSRSTLRMFVILPLIWYLVFYPLFIFVSAVPISKYTAAYNYVFHNDSTGTFVSTQGEIGDFGCYNNYLNYELNTTYKNDPSCPTIVHVVPEVKDCIPTSLTPFCVTRVGNALKFTVSFGASILTELGIVKAAVSSLVPLSVPNFIAPENISNVDVAKFLYENEGNNITGYFGVERIMSRLAPHTRYSSYPSHVTLPEIIFRAIFSIVYYKGGVEYSNSTHTIQSIGDKYCLQLFPFSLPSEETFCYTTLTQFFADFMFDGVEITDYSILYNWLLPLLCTVVVMYFISFKIDCSRHHNSSNAMVHVLSFFALLIRLFVNNYLSAYIVPYGIISTFLDMLLLYNMNTTFWHTFVVLLGYTLCSLYYYLPIAVAIFIIIVAHKIYSLYKLKMFKVESLRNNGSYNPDFAVCAQHTIMLNSIEVRKLLEETSMDEDQIVQCANQLSRFRNKNSTFSTSNYVQHCKAALASHIKENYMGHIIGASTMTSTYHPPTYVDTSTLGTVLQSAMSSIMPVTCVPECELPAKLIPHIYKVSYTIGTTTTSMSGVHVGNYVITQRHVLGAPNKADNESVKAFYKQQMTSLDVANLTIESTSGKVLSVQSATMCGVLLKLKVAEVGAIATLKRATPYNPFTILHCNMGVPLTTCHAYLDERGVVRGPFSAGSCGSIGFTYNCGVLEIVYVHCMIVEPGYHSGCDGQGVMYGNFVDASAPQRLGPSKPIYPHLVHMAVNLTTQKHTQTTPLKTFVSEMQALGYSFNEEIQRLFKAKCVTLNVNPENVYNAVLNRLAVNNPCLPKDPTSIAPEALLNYARLQSSVVSTWGSMFLYLIIYLLMYTLIAFMCTHIYGVQLQTVMLTACALTLFSMFFIKYKVAFLFAILIPTSIEYTLRYFIIYNLLTSYTVLVSIVIVLTIVHVVSYYATSSKWYVAGFRFFVGMGVTITYYYFDDLDRAIHGVSMLPTSLFSMDATFAAIMAKALINQNYLSLEHAPLINAAIVALGFTYFGYTHIINFVLGLNFFKYGVFVSREQMYYMARNNIKPPTNAFANIRFNLMMSHIGGKKNIRLSSLQASSADIQVCTAAIYKLLTDTVTLKHNDSKEICALFNALTTNPTEAGLTAFVYKTYLVGGAEYRTLVEKMLNTLPPEVSHGILQSMGSNLDPYVVVNDTTKELEAIMAVHRENPSDSTTSTIKRLQKIINRAQNEIQQMEAEKKKLNKMQQDLLAKLAKDARAQQTKTQVVSTLSSFVGQILKTLDEKAIIDLYAKCAPSSLVPLYLIPRYVSANLDVFVKDKQQFDEHFVKKDGSYITTYHGKVYNLIKIVDMDNASTTLDDAVFPIRAECSLPTNQLQNNEVHHYDFTVSQGVDNNGEIVKCFILPKHLNKTAVAISAKGTNVTHFKIDNLTFNVEPVPFKVGSVNFYLVKDSTSQDRAHFYAYLHKTVHLQSSHVSATEGAIVKSLYYSVTPTEDYLAQNVVIQSTPVRASASIPTCQRPHISAEPVNYTNYNTYAGHTVCIPCIALQNHECKFRGKWCVIPAECADPVRYNMTAQLCEDCNSYKVAGRCICSGDAVLQSRILGQRENLSLITFTNAVSEGLTLN